MKRRNVLATAGIIVPALTGYGYVSKNNTMDIRTPNISVQTEGKRQSDTGFSVKLLQQFTGEHPAKVNISYTNTADGEQQILFDGPPPFYKYKSKEHESSHLVVIPDDHTHISSEEGGQLVPQDPKDGCWTVPRQLSVYGTAVKETISSGETVSQEYTILNHWANRECLPPGKYLFEQSSPLTDHEQAWKFSVNIHD